MRIVSHAKRDATDNLPFSSSVSELPKIMLSNYNILALFKMPLFTVLFRTQTVYKAQADAEKIKVRHSV